MSLSRKNCFIKECELIDVSWVCITSSDKMVPLDDDFCPIPQELGEDRKRGTFSMAPCSLVSTWCLFQNTVPNWT